MVTIASSVTDRHNNGVKGEIDENSKHYAPGIQGISDCCAKQHKTKRGVWSPIILTTEPKNES
jgi:hypothetical protein